MSKRTDVRPVAATLYFLPLEVRVPLKFGPEVLSIRDRSSSENGGR